MIVKMFQPRFAPLVESGAKIQTIRPTPKRMPRVGAEISCRVWEGKPYRSKQREILCATVRMVSLVRLAGGGILIAPYDPSRDPVWSPVADLGAFARADGFASWDDMRSWFSDTHGLPFSGLLIQWQGGAR